MPAWRACGLIRCFTQPGIATMLSAVCGALLDARLTMPAACCCPLLQARLSKANEAQAKAESNLSAVRTQSQGLANEYDRWVERWCCIVCCGWWCCIVAQALVDEYSRWLAGPHCCSRHAAMVWVGVLRCEMLLHCAGAGWCCITTPIPMPARR